MNLSLLSKAEFCEKYMDILQSIEEIVSSVYFNTPELHDHDVLRVYEALSKYVKAKLTHFPLRPHNLEGISLSIYEKLHQTIQSYEETYSLLEIQQCLKTLEKSVNYWNSQQGSRGYLNFITQFVG